MGNGEWGMMNGEDLPPAILETSCTQSIWHHKSIQFICYRLRLSAVHKLKSVFLQEVFER